MLDMSARVNPPPDSDLMSFEDFSTAILSAPLEDLYNINFNDGDEQDGIGDSSLLNEQEEDTDLNFSDQIGMDTGANYLSDLIDDSDSEADYDPIVADADRPVYVTPNTDIDRSRLRPSHAQSRHMNPELQALAHETEVALEQLSLQFQPIIESQSMSTNILLANQAVEEVLLPYGRHGCLDRLSEAAMRYLEGGDVIRRKDGKCGLAKLKIVQDDDKDKQAMRVEKKRKADDERDAPGESEGRRGTLKIKIVKKNDGTSMIMPVSPHPMFSAHDHDEKRHTFKESTKPGNIGSTLPDNKTRRGSIPAETSPLKGSQTLVDSLSNRKTSGPLDLVLARDDSAEETLATMTDMAEDSNHHISDITSFPSKPRPRNMRDLKIDTKSGYQGKIEYTPLAKYFQDIAIKSPNISRRTSSEPSKLHRQFTASHSLTIDPALNASLALEAYNPISLEIIWPASIPHPQNPTSLSHRRPSMPTPTLLDALNNIVHLTNAEGRNLLSYYVNKFNKPLTHTNTSQNPYESAPPHALLRLGISQYLNSKVGNILNNRDTDVTGLALTPETRRVLGEVWSAHPAIHGDFTDKACYPQSYESSVAQPAANVDTDEAISTVNVSNVNAPDSDRNQTQPDTTDSLTLYCKNNNLHKYHLGLNPLERKLLSRACNVDIKTVEAYWEFMKEETKAWGGLKLWAEMQSRKEIEIAKKEGRW